MENNIVPKQMQDVMMDRAIPGQSLTNAPDQNYAWEGQPKYTSVKKAREDIFLNLLKPETLEGVQKLLINKVPVNAIAEMVLTDGFRTGKFNPDMMLNLLEPTMNVMQEKDNYIKGTGTFREAVVPNINPASVGKDIQEKLEGLDSEKVRQSILQRPSPVIKDSLLGETNGR